MRRILISLALLSAVATAPVFAQDSAIGLRVEKLEKELKAVQRKVFPNGQPIQPEISGITDQGGTGSSSALSDLTTRVDSLEAQLKQMTGQVESQGSRLNRLEEQSKATRTDFDTRLKALEADPKPVVADSEPVHVTTPTKTSAAAPQPVTKTSVVPKPAAKQTLAAPTDGGTKQTPTAKPDTKRKAQIDAVEIPRSGDPADDAYVYGYRLWQAKLYPEAQVQLKQVVAKYPKSKRASHAQNLLGKAYLDEGKPALASVAFFEHYSKNPKGERADDSLYSLGVALTRLNKLKDACRVFDEFGDVYGATASSALKAKVTKGRADAKCAV
jgi:TolA-binding protein